MNNQEGILCERRTYSNDSSTHHHDFAQLILPLEGTLTIETNYHNLKLDADHLFFIPPALDHTFCARERNEFLVLDIPVFTFPEVYQPDLNNELFTELDDKLRAIRLLMVYESQPGKNHSRGLTDLIRYTSGLLFPAAVPTSIDYIHQHYFEKISLDQLALLEHFNTTYYCEWFNKKMGVTPITYIQNIRLKKAQELLQETDLSVMEIAHLVGYEQQSSLTRLFRKHLGQSPRAYRNT